MPPPLASFIEDGRLWMEEQDISMYEREELINFIVMAAASGVLSYPFVRLCISDPLPLFENLKQMKLEISTDPFSSPNKAGTELVDVGQSPYLSIICKRREYFLGDIITDIYAEEARMRCREMRSPIPIEEWKKRGSVEKWVSLCLGTFGILTPFTMRESIFQSHLYKECNQYKPSVVVYLINLFRAKRVLDLSCGWGDRLIGSLAAGAEAYHGCDPNPDLSPVYAGMVRDLGGDTDVRIEQSKMEDYTVREGFYDLFHSSPPFWIKEQYNTMRVDIGLDEWVEDFLLLYVDKAMRGLRRGGIMAIYINDVGRIKYVDRMNDHIFAAGHKYRGSIGLRGATSSMTYNIWLWERK